jgi:hypothetical protein
MEPAVNSVSIIFSFQWQVSGRHFGECKFGFGHQADKHERPLSGNPK